MNILYSLFRYRSLIGVLAFLIFHTCTLSGQDIFLRGRITDAITQESLPGASVFFNNTTIGTVSDNDGKFELKVDSSFTELIVSFVGYHSAVYKVDLSQLNRTYKFELQPDTQVLDDIEVHATRDEVWYHNLAYFTETFIGTSTIAQDVEIMNPEVIYFETSDDVFRVHARAPLIIKNKALGYELEYTLEQYERNYHTQTLTVLGYPRFIEMKGSKRKNKKWNKRRNQAYLGSMAHFLHSVCRDDFADQGYVVQRIYEQENEHYPSDESIAWAQEQRRLWLMTGRDFREIPDSVRSILSLSREPKVQRILSTTELIDIPGFDKANKGHTWSFDHLLRIQYLEEKADKNYVPPGQLFAPKVQPPQTSIISSTTKSILIDETCALSSPLDIRVEEYWGFEKIAEMLPLDYLKKQLNR